MGNEGDGRLRSILDLCLQFGHHFFQFAVLGLKLGLLLGHFRLFVLQPILVFEYFEETLLLAVELLPQLLDLVF